MKPNIKIIRLKKHNWFVCLFSKKKREERKGWEARWGKHLTEAQEIEVAPMKYEPHKPFYSDYTYKNTENDVNKNEWITDRKPNAHQEMVWNSQGVPVFPEHLEDGEAWKPLIRPAPYVNPNAQPLELKKYVNELERKIINLERRIDDLFAIVVNTNTKPKSKMPPPPPPPTSSGTILIKEGENP